MKTSRPFLIALASLLTLVFVQPAVAKVNVPSLIGPFKAGGPFVLTVTGTNTLSFKNVLVGEVWVCSGQSNMEWPLINTKGGAEAVAQANFPEIRLFTVAKKTAASPLTDVEGRWVIASPEQVGQFSAVAYYFG